MNALPTTPADLKGLTDDEFRAVVDADIRRTSRRNPSNLPETISRALRSPEYVERWYSVLRQAANSIEGQLVAWAEDFEVADGERQLARARVENEIEALKRAGGDAFEAGCRLLALDEEIQAAKAEYLKRRGNTLKFKGGLDAALFEAERVTGSYQDNRVRQLEGAIRRHRNAVTDDPTIDPSSADEDLWNAL